jgi:hypothetical protein
MPECKKIHFVGLASICWAIRKTRNLVCFEGKIVKSLTEIVCLASSFIAYWAGIHKKEEKAMLETGAEAMKVTTLHFHSMQDPEIGGNGTVLLH